MRPHLKLVVLLVTMHGSVNASQECIPTERDSLGPFYVAGTAVTNSLNRQGKSGDPLVVSGRILSAHPDRRPLAGARIEVWQTDGKGRYFPQGSGRVDDYPESAIDLRGTVIADATGKYRFDTVVPGGYFPRPRHFHYRIRAPDHAPLVTQLYITGDGFIRQPGDDCRHAPLTTTGAGSKYEAPDLFLQPE